MSRTIRVRRENVAGIICALIAAGFEAALSNNRPSASYLGGCCDPGCCQPHPEAICDWLEGGETGWAHMPEGWSLIETNASGNRAHQVIEAWKERFSSPSCSGPDGGHGYADHTCKCGFSVCSDCAAYDNRGLPYQEAPVLTCPRCGANVLE